MCVQGQQYRWLSGPMQVIKKSIGITWSSKVCVREGGGEGDREGTMR